MSQPQSAADRRIVDLFDRLGRISYSLQFAEGLNPAQWIALRYLARAKPDSSSPGALAAFMNSTRGTVSQTLKSLEEKGLVERSRRPGDRRGVHVAVTPLGLELLERDPLATIPDAVSPRSETERESFVSDLKRLLDALLSHHGFAEFGSCPECRFLVADDPSGANLCGVTGKPVLEEELNGICTRFMRDR